MRPPLSSYSFLLLLPATLAFLSGVLLQDRSAAARSLESAERLGTLTAILLRREMSDMATELARQAAPVENPDSASPVVQAAMVGDTVAALGTLSGELVLSVALAQETRDPAGDDAPVFPHLRAMTAPFPASSLQSLRGRTGFGAALYLRGARVEGKGGPEGFGPLTLSGRGTASTEGGGSTVATSLGPAMILPLAWNSQESSPVELLVAPGDAGLRSPASLAGALVLLLGCSIGLILLWTGMGQRRRTSALSMARIELLYLAPVGALWVALFVLAQELRSGAETFGRVEMVRTLGLLRDGGGGIDLGDITRATGFAVTRVLEAQALESTVEDSLLVRAIVELPTPSPSIPATGVVGKGDTALPYASLLEEGGTTLVLTAAPNGKPLRFVRLLQAVLGGAASTLGLVFVFSASRSRRARGGTQPEKSGGRAP